MEGQETANSKAKQIIKENIFATLATSDRSGVPWATPFNYSCDEKYVFYMFSSKNSRHMKNIAINKNVSMAIFDSTARKDDIDGVQIEAKAEILEGDSLAKEWNHIFKAKFAGRRNAPTIENFGGTSLRRIAKITPSRFYKFDRTSVPGEDERQEVWLR